MILNESTSARLNLFLLNLKPSLKQRPESIRVFIESDSEKALATRVKEFCYQLEMENTFLFVTKKVDDLDFTEKLVEAFFIDIENEISGTIAIEKPNKTIANHMADAFDNGSRYEIVISEGEKIYAHSWGEITLPSITIIMPLGIPVEIMRNWVVKLSDSYHLISWETKGIFLPSSKRENLDLSMKSHLDDLEKVLSFFAIKKTHLFAICQGVNLALHALKKFQPIVHSATLWHGDYNWNDEKKSTFTQNNFQKMILMSKSGVDIGGLRLIMCNPKVIDTLKEEYKLEILPLIMYPYITKEVFQSYVTISETVISDDLDTFSRNIEQKVLIATSKEDKTAHPMGSEELHKRMPQSTFYCREKGSHVSFFEAPNELLQLFLNFY